MSGHSKWAQIKRQKGVKDQKRGALFTKLSNAITVAASEGGGEPETNFKLRLAIDKAKAANMPKENIERAIRRGTGQEKGQTLEEILYEGYGPGGVAIIIDVLTDNRNRAHAAVKHILEKYSGSLGAPNSVLWQFVRRGVLRFQAAPGLKEELELKAIEAGAEDIREENSDITIYTDPSELKRVKEQLENQKVIVEYAEVEYVPNQLVEIDDKSREQLEKLFVELDESEEVNDYYTNLK